jgi:hypothetical protein
MWEIIAVMIFDRWKHRHRKMFNDENLTVSDGFFEARTCLRMSSTLRQIYKKLKTEGQRAAERGDREFPHEGRVIT